MDIDVARYVGAVTRTVKTLHRDGRPVKAVIADRSYDSTIEDVWDALTNAERIPRWFAPVSGELKQGGRYQIKGNAGGTITECAPPRRLALTWECGAQMSWVSVSLAPDARGGVKLELEHVLPVDGHWDEFGPGATGVGWDLGLVGLAQHLASGAAVDHEAAEAWAASENGKAFIRGSTDGLRAADVAGGEEPGAAAAAASKTAAFYTGAG